MGGHGKIGRSYELRFHDLIGDFFSSQFVISNFIIFSTKIAGTRPGGGMNE